MNYNLESRTANFGVIIKEANETKHWLNMITAIDNNYKKDCLVLHKETHGLTLIFAAISRSLNKN